MSFTDANPSHSKEQLLNDIFVAAGQPHIPGLPLRPFAALMVKVADETGETVDDLKAHITRLNEQNAKLQWWVVALAVAALVGTLVQTGAAIYALTASPAPPMQQTTAGSLATEPVTSHQAQPSSGVAASAGAGLTSRSPSPLPSAAASAGKQ